MVLWGFLLGESGKDKNGFNINFIFLGQYAKRKRKFPISFCENGEICQKLSIFRCGGVLFMVSLSTVQRDLTRLFGKVNIREKRKK